MTEHAQVMRHYDRTRAVCTALLLEHKALHIPNHFMFSDARTYDAYTYPLGNRRSYFRNKLPHKQRQPLKRTLPGSVSHRPARPASHSARYGPTSCVFLDCNRLTYRTRPGEATAESARPLGYSYHHHHLKGQFP